MSRGGDLLRLQEIDQRLERERRRLQELEAQVAGDPALDGLRRELRRRRREQATADAELAAAETESETLRRRVRELDGHLYDGSVRNPQELLGMQHELEVLRERAAQLDERLLALMEGAEGAAAATAAAAAAVETRQGERAAGAGRLEEDVTAAQAAVTVLDEERATVVDALPAADRSLYERLARRLHPAVVHLERDGCGGCRMPLSASEVRHVRQATELVQCSECDRVVVS